MGCEKHPNYKGLRLTKNASKCEDCVEFYNENKKAGIKGSRNRKGKADSNVTEVKACEPNALVTEVEEMGDVGSHFVIDDLTFNDVLDELGIEEGGGNEKKKA